MTHATSQQSPMLLKNITFDTYQSLLRHYADRNSPRLTYDRGTLEIMSPLTRRHEEANRTLARIVETLLDVWESEYVNIGSMTFQRSDVERGFEPDTGFYIQNAELIAGKDEIDLQSGDPAPDLVIEVDVTSPSLPRLPIYAAFQVREIWRCENGIVTILVLAGDLYADRQDSITLPGVSGQLLTEWLSQSRTMRRSEWTRALREWASQNLPDR